MSRKLALLVLFGVLLVGGVVFFRGANVGTAALWELSREGQWLLPLVLVSALIDSINPCAFSILIVTIAFLFSLGKLRSHVLEIGGAYVLGIFLVYSLIGLGILQTLHLFDTPHFMAKVGAGLLVLFGLLSLTNALVPRFPIRLGIPQAAHQRMASLMEKASLPSAFALGGLVGVCEFPCTGGPYLLVLGLLHDQASFAAGLGYLMLYNAVFVLPLIVILLISSDRSLLEKVQQWKKRRTGSMRLWGGGAMVALGVLVYNL
jgi:cytochrome c-type biogenesis protein